MIPFLRKPAGWPWNRARLRKHLEKFRNPELITHTARLQVTAASQINVHVQPWGSDDYKHPGELMQQAQEIAQRAQRPVVFIDRDATYYTFYPIK